MKEDLRWSEAKPIAQEACSNGLSLTSKRFRMYPYVCVCAPGSGTNKQMNALDIFLFQDLSSKQLWHLTVRSFARWLRILPCFTCSGFNMFNSNSLVNQTKPQLRVNLYTASAAFLEFPKAPNLRDDEQRRGDLQVLRQTCVAIR